MVATIVCLVLASWLWALIFHTREKNRLKRFSQFIAENAETLLNGGSCEFEGDKYSLSTKLVQYQFAVSLISISMTRGTSLRPEKDKVWLLLSCTIISALGGWWGIPWGPYHTILSFIENGKAKPVTLQELLLSTSK